MLVLEGGPTGASGLGERWSLLQEEEATERPRWPAPGLAPAGRSPAQFPRRIRNVARQLREHAGPTGTQLTASPGGTPPHLSMDARGHDCNCSICPGSETTLTLGGLKKEHRSRMSPVGSGGRGAGARGAGFQARRPVAAWSSPHPRLLRNRVGIKAAGMVWGPLRALAPIRELSQSAEYSVMPSSGDRPA